MTNFFVIEQALRKPSGAGATVFDLGHGTRPHGTLGMFETAYIDDLVRASDIGYCTLPSDPSGPIPYPPRVQEAFAVDAMVNLDPGQSAVGASWGAIKLANNDSKYDLYITGGWSADGRSTRILYGNKTLENFSGFATARSTPATSLDQTNTLKLAAPAVVRQDYSSLLTPDSLATNWCRNAVGGGAVAGTIGSGGAMPSGWAATAAGLAIDVSTHRSPLIGSANVVRLRFHGTTTAATGSLNYANTGSLGGLLNNAPVVQSIYLALVAGAFTHLTQIVHWLAVNDATALGVSVPQINFMPSITNTLTRFFRTYSTPATGPAPFGATNPSIVFYWPTGSVVDFTIDVAAPQYELGTVPTPFIPTTAGEVTHGDATVNYILHADTSGVVVGTPGTLPTGWTLNLGGGVSQQVVAAATDGVTGYKYIDLRFFGTTTSTQSSVTFCPFATIDANTGQAWCQTLYAQFTAGSQTGITFQLGANECNSAGTVLRLAADTASPLSLNGISRARRVAPIVTNQATTRYLQPTLVINYASGVAIDCTIRLMAPQCEGGAVQTAFVPTVAAPASRRATYGVTGTPTLLSEPAATNYVLSTQIPAVANVTVAASTDVPAILSGTPVWKHTRTATGADSNSGAIGVTGLPSTGVQLRASGWIWLPSFLSSAKTSIAISLEGNTTGGVSVAANRALVDQWQRITVAATLTAAATSTTIVFRITPQLAGDVVYSSAWQLELNAVTSFIPPAITPALRDADGFYTARGIFVDPPYASLVPAFNGVAGALTADDSEITIPLRDASYWLERPLLRSTYGGSGRYDGTTVLAGTLKPLAIGGTRDLATTPNYFGAVHNITPVLVDPPALIYQVSDSTLGKITALYEGGYAGGITFAGDVPDLYVGLTPAGQYRTCVALGCFQLGSTPIRAITCDVVGLLVPPVSGTLTELTALAVVYYAMTQLSGVPPELVASADGVHLDAIGATAPLNSACAFFLAPGDSPTGIDLVTRILAPAGMKLVACRDGLLRALVIATLPTTPTIKATLDNRTIISIAPIDLPSAIDPPPYRMRVGYNDNYTVQTSDISPLAGTARQQYMAIPASIAQANPSATVLLSGIALPNDIPVITGSIVDGRTVTGVSAATASAARYATLWGIRRRVYGVVVPFQVGVALEYGDVVHLATDLPDLAGGKNVQVVGYSYRSEDASITLRLLT